MDILHLTTQHIISYIFVIKIIQKTKKEVQWVALVEV